MTLEEFLHAEDFPRYLHLKLSRTCWHLLCFVLRIDRKRVMYCRHRSLHPGKPLQLVFKEHMKASYLDRIVVGTLGMPGAQRTISVSAFFSVSLHYFFNNRLNNGFFILGLHYFFNNFCSCMHIILSGVWLISQFSAINKSLLMKLFKPLSVDCYSKHDFCGKGENILRKRKLEDIQQYISSISHKWLNQAFTL